MTHLCESRLLQQDVVFLANVSLSCGLPKATFYKNVDPEAMVTLCCHPPGLLLTRPRFCVSVDQCRATCSFMYQVGLENVHVVAIEIVVSDIHVFVSSRGDLDVTILDHMKNMIKRSGSSKNISHFDNVINPTGPETERQENRQPEASEVRLVVPESHGLIVLMLARRTMSTSRQRSSLEKWLSLSHTPSGPHGSYPETNTLFECLQSLVTSPHYRYWVVMSVVMWSVLYERPQTCEEPWPTCCLRAATPSRTSTDAKWYVVNGRRLKPPLAFMVPSSLHKPSAGAASCFENW